MRNLKLFSSVKGSFAMFLILLLDFEKYGWASAFSNASVSWVSSLPHSNPSSCEKIDWPYFHCSSADNTCFTFQEKCDGHSDCVAAEDECHSMCVETFECASRSAANYKCIAMDQFCDGKNDCQDGSDEMIPDGTGFDCPNLWQTALNFSELNWQHWKERRVPWNMEARKWFQLHGAPNQRSCKLPDHLVCDGINHCGNHADECSERANCGDKAKFICNNSKCISKANFCDGRNDCGDNSDECHPDCKRSFQCKNGQCISMNQFCDGIRDCEDGTDEIDLKNGSENTEYFNGSTMCSNIANLNSKKCLIPSRYLCDGYEHCVDREDECTPGCRFSLVCPNGKCFFETKRCNGYDDCGDMSDECGFDCHWQFHCDNNTCLSFDRFCDGVEDCINGEDEITEPKDDGSVMCVNQFGLSTNTKQCVLPSRYICDRLDHCRDRTDECQSNCQMSFYCDNDKTCISKKSLCDENHDCKDGTDEPGFGLKFFHQRGFKCRISRNGEVKQYVLPQILLHDNIPDCVDYSDLCFHSDNKTGFRSLNNCTQCLVSKDIFISQRQICDGIFDCPDLSDECLCDNDNTPSVCDHVCFDNPFPEKCPCPIGFVPCLSDSGLASKEDAIAINGSNVCIPHSAFCNGEADCPNGTDERFCNLNNNGSLVETVERKNCLMFKPLNIWTPQSAFRCDNSPECYNMEDECDFDCNPIPEFCQKRNFAGTYLCPDQEVIPGRLVCNGQRNCGPSAADEENCPERFYCENNTDIISVSNDKVCDFNIDCADESDEMNCPSTHFYCDDNQPPYFIPLWKKMDGTIDCKDGSDECPKKSFENLIFSSSEFLIKQPFLQFMIWVMGLIASLGNLCVFVHTIFILRHPARYKLTKVAVVNNLLVLNLCTADFLMGIFLLVLAGKNALTSGHYCRSDRAWRSGTSCRFLGVISTLSAEVSLTTLAVLASYRLYCVLRPIQSRGMKLHKAIVHILWTWCFAFVVALLPFHKSYQGYFTNEVWIQKNPYFSEDLVTPRKLERFCNALLGYNATWTLNDSNSSASSLCSKWENLVKSAKSFSVSHEIQGFMGYYSNHATCLPKLFLTKNDQSWEYSFGVTLFNFLVCLYIVAVYATLWSTRHVKKSAISSQSTKNLQRRIALLVCSDCACWLPICIVAFLHLSGLRMSPSTYSVTAVILLPINSALNPIFYSNALQILYVKFTAYLHRFEALNKLRKNIRSSCYGRFVKKQKKEPLTDNETSLLPNATSGPDGSRILTELTFDYSSLPESTV